MNAKMSLHIALLFAVAALLATRSVAQEPDEKPKSMPDKGGDRPVDRSPGVSKPEVPDAARLDLGNNRNARVVQANPSAPEAVGYMYVYPILALVPNPTPLKDRPFVVWHERKTKAGTTVLTFRVSRFTADLEPSVRAALARDWNGWRDNEAKIRIRPLPLDHAVIDLRLDNRVLATAETGSLASIGNELDFKMEFGAQELAEFYESPQDAAFRFAYSYGRVAVVSGEASTKITNSVVRVLDGKVRNLTRNTSSVQQVILASDKKQLLQNINTTIKRAVRATDEKIVGMLTKEIPALESLFKVETIKWDQLDGTLLAKLAEVLTPLVQTDKENYKHDEAHLIEWEKNDEIMIDKGGSIGFSIPLGKATGDIKADARKTSVTKLRNFLKDEFGIHTELDSEKKAYKPVKIEVYRYTGTTEETALTDTIHTSLQVRTLDGYVQDSDVLLSWTLNKVIAFCKDENSRLDEVAKADAEAKRELAKKEEEERAKKKVLDELTTLEEAAKACRKEFDAHTEPVFGDTAMDKRIREAFKAEIGKIDGYLNRLTAEKFRPQPNAVGFRGVRFGVDIARSVVHVHGWIPPVEILHGNAGQNKSLISWGSAARIEIAPRFIRSVTLCGPNGEIDIPLHELRKWAKWSSEFDGAAARETILGHLRERPWARLEEKVILRTEDEKNSFYKYWREKESKSDYTLLVKPVYGKEIDVPLGNYSK